VIFVIFVVEALVLPDDGTTKSTKSTKEKTTNGFRIYVLLPFSPPLLCVIFFCWLRYQFNLPSGQE